MKKTISVNIKGINFQVEEHAYELLQDYLDRLSSTLEGQEGATEIVEDVELRIAELCSAKLSDSKSVIEHIDIVHILETLGNPEDFIDQDEETEPINNQHESAQSEKKLFRDVENSTIAGVCAGIANFFNIDVIIIRAIFVIMFLFAGFGFPLYIILWIVIPKAQSTIDRLRMKGRPITVENLKAEVENAADSIREGSNKFAKKVRSNQPKYQRGVSRGFEIIASLFGIGMIGMGLFFLVMFLIFIVSGAQIIPVHSDYGFLSITELGSYVLSDEGDVLWAWIGGSIFSLSVIFFWILLGTMLVFKIRNKWGKLSLLGLFITGIVGVIICGMLGVKTGRDMAIEGEIERKVGVANTTELYIEANLEKLPKIQDFNVKSNGRYGFMTIGEKNIKLHGVRFKYRRSQDSSFHIYQNLSAHSVSHKTAIDKSKNIKHSIGLSGDTLMVNPGYSFPKTDKLRDQEVVVIIEIPVDGSIRFNDRIIRLGSEEFDEEIVDESYEEGGMLRGNGKYRHWD